MPSVLLAGMVSSLQVAFVENKSPKKQGYNEHVRLRGDAWPCSDKILMKSVGKQCKFYPHISARIKLLASNSSEILAHTKLHLVARGSQEIYEKLSFS